MLPYFLVLDSCSASHAELPSVLLIASAPHVIGSTGTVLVRCFLSMVVVVSVVTIMLVGELVIAVVVSLSTSLFATQNIACHILQRDMG